MATRPAPNTARFCDLKNGEQFQIDAGRFVKTTDLSYLAIGDGEESTLSIGGARALKVTVGDIAAVRLAESARHSKWLDEQTNEGPSPASRKRNRP